MQSSAALAMAHTMEQDRVNFLQTLRAPQQGVRRGFGRTEQSCHSGLYLRKKAVYRLSSKS